MEADDPFSSITELCQLSSSQEERLRQCRFAGEPEADTQVYGEIDEKLTGIMMVTSLESPQDNVENDNITPEDDENFQTPPENSQIASSDECRDDRTVVFEEETEGGCAEGEKSVDLGADTDLGFSEVELTQRSGRVNEVIQYELNKIRVLKRELAASECLIESLKKRSKISDNNLCTESPKRCLGESVKNIMKSSEKLTSNKDTLYICGDKSPHSNQNSEPSGESSAKRKLDFSTENLGLETEVSDRGLGFSEGLEHSMRNCEPGRSVCNNGKSGGTSNLGRKSIRDIDKYKCTDPSVCNSSEKGRETLAIRTLPVSICGKADKNARNDSREISLWDILGILARKCDYDHSLESKSILYVAKSQGMTFP